MTLQQSLDLAEIEADIAHDRFLDAFTLSEDTEILEQLETEATAC